MKRVLFYITPHGFGHAVRTIELSNQLTAKDPSVRPIINTGAVEWLFKQRLDADFEYIQCENDIGVVQKDWRGVEKLETLRRYEQFIEKEPEFIRSQVDFVKRNDITAIVSDIPATPFVIAKQAGVPGFGITNFSWDWIYEPYAEQYPQYRFVVEHLRQCYHLADCLLRLPFYGDLSAFPVIEDIPLIATRSTAKRDDVVQNLNIAPERKIVLLYLGSFDYGRVLTDEVLQREDYYFLTPETYSNRDLPFQDLLKAADVAVTKPGYGIVSECIANQTPIMYTAREDFREYHPLVEGLKKYAHNHFIPQEELLGGGLVGHLDQLLAGEFKWPQIPVDGARIAADRILQVM